MGKTEKGMLTNFYGLQTIDQNILFVDHLRELLNLFQNQNWIIGLDFDMIANLLEKRRG